MILAAVEAAEAQADDALSRRRKADAERQQRRRAGKACHVTSRDVTVTPRDVTDAPLDGPLSPCTPLPPYNPPNPVSPTAPREIDAGGEQPTTNDAIPEFQTSHEFPAFWHRYPNKTKREAARNAWHKARQTTSVEEIMAGLDRYIAHLHGPDPPHPANPDNWLIDKRWTDEPMERTNARHAPTSRPGRQYGHGPSQQDIRRAILDGLSGELDPGGTPAVGH